MAEKFRPQFTMLEINCILTALDHTVNTMSDNGILVITAPDGTELSFIEMHKVVHKVFKYKAKAEIDVNMPSYTTSRAKPGRPSNEEKADDALGVKKASVVAQETGAEPSKEAVLYTKYIQGQELNDREKVWAIGYKMAEDKKNVTEEEREFYSANIMLTL